jgi:hypothetical protein
MLAARRSAAIVRVGNPDWDAALFMGLNQQGGHQ